MTGLPREVLKKLTPKQADAFALIERAALAGARCPVDQPNGAMPSRMVAELARLKLVRVEIFARNFRVVTLLAGVNAGRSTLKPGTGVKPWRTSDEPPCPAPGRIAP